MVEAISPEIIAGVLVKVCAATTANLGVNTQKLSFLQEAAKPVAERLPIVQQWKWWLGLIGVVLGAILDFVAVGLAPQSVVAPAGAFTLVSNVFFAHFLLKETIGRTEIIATCVVVLGAIISVAFGSRTSRSYSLQELVALWSNPTMIVYAVVIAVFGISMVMTIQRAEMILANSVREMFKAYEIPSGGETDALQGPTTPAKAPPGARPGGEVEMVGGSHRKSVGGVLASGSGGLRPRSLSDSERAVQTGDTTMAGLETERLVSSDTDVVTHGDGVDTEASVDIRSTVSGAVATAMVTEALTDPPPEYEFYSRLHPLSYATLAGLVGSMSVVFSKCVAEIFALTFAGENQFVYGLTYVFILSLVAAIVLQQRFMAKGLQLFPSVLIVPVFSSSFMAFSIIGGGIYFQEFASFTPLQSGLFPIGVLLTLLGVAILSGRKDKGKSGKSSTAGDSTAGGSSIGDKKDKDKDKDHAHLVGAHHGRSSEQYSTSSSDSSDDEAGGDGAHLHAAEEGRRASKNGRRPMAAEDVSLTFGAGGRGTLGSASLDDRRHTAIGLHTRRPFGQENPDPDMDESGGGIPSSTMSAAEQQSLPPLPPSHGPVPRGSGGGLSRGGEMEDTSRIMEEDEDEEDNEWKGGIGGNRKLDQFSGGGGRGGGGGGEVGVVEIGAGTGTGTDAPPSQNRSWPVRPAMAMQSTGVSGRRRGTEMPSSMPLGRAISNPTGGRPTSGVDAVRQARLRAQTAEVTGTPGTASERERRLRFAETSHGSAMRLGERTVGDRRLTQDQEDDWTEQYLNIRLWGRRGTGSSSFKARPHLLRGNWHRRVSRLPGPLLASNAGGAGARRNTKSRTSVFLTSAFLGDGFRRSPQIRQGTTTTTTNTTTSAATNTHDFSGPGVSRITSAPAPSQDIPDRRPSNVRPDPRRRTRAGSILEATFSALEFLTAAQQATSVTARRVSVMVEMQAAIQERQEEQRARRRQTLLHGKPVRRQVSDGSAERVRRSRTRSVLRRDSIRPSSHQRTTTNTGVRRTTSVGVPHPHTPKTFDATASAPAPHPGFRTTAPPLGVAGLGELSEDDDSSNSENKEVPLVITPSPGSPRTRRKPASKPDEVEDGYATDTSAP